MSEKTSMFELLNERMEKEDIVKLVCNYDNKFNELKENNKQLKSQLQQKENIIKELNDTIKELQEDIDVLTSDDDNDSVWLEKENM